MSATPGYGSINQLVLESMALNTGTKFVHVPYKGGAPAAQALVAGDIPLGILASSSVAPFVPSGKIRVLAVTDREALAAQSGMADAAGRGRRRHRCLELDGACWRPRRCRKPIIDKLNAKVVEILNMPDVKARFAGGGVSTIPSSPAELAAKIKREARRSIASSSRRPMSTSTEGGAAAGRRH